jgi:3-methyl-2-oxobutanoate hydroxymethyltransferase
VKEFAKIGDAIESAVQSYAKDVRARKFPAPEHTYAMKGKAGAATKKTKMTGS